MTFVNALSIMGESAKRKADVVGSGTTGEVDGEDNEEKKKLMTYLNILDKLEGIGATPFTKAVKTLKEDPGGMCFLHTFSYDFFFFNFL